MSTSVFTRLLEGATAPPASADVHAYLARLPALPADLTTVERAALAGAQADRLGFAFAGGYQAALAKLVPGTVRASLCATEAGGGHPKAIATRLEPAAGAGFTLTGEKTFATLARAAETLLVVASEGQKEGRNRLRLVRVPADREGVSYKDSLTTPFAPEIPHSVVQLAGVRVDEADVLPGDGYDLYLKPFRTIEDVHVMAAAVGYALRCGLAFGFPREVIERLLAHLASLVAVGGGAPLDRGVHLALAGIIAGVRETLADSASHWAGAPEDVRERWLRDVGLLHVADRVRAARTEAAWRPA